MNDNNTSSARTVLKFFSYIYILIYIYIYIYIKYSQYKQTICFAMGLLFAYENQSQINTKKRHMLKLILILALHK